MCMKIRCAHQALVLNLVCIPAQEYLGTRPWQTPLLGSLPYPFPSVQGKQKQQMPSVSWFPNLLIFLQLNHENAFNAV